MLHKETVEGKTFELLKQLMEDHELTKFNLVGGTALSLTMGYRMSIDIDLFSIEPFEIETLKNHLSLEYGFCAKVAHKSTLLGYIDNVKLDLLQYPYPLVRELRVVDGIRMYSLEDIAAMKLTAIADSGTRLKDFIDVACLSTYCSLNTMLDAYEFKFPNTERMRAIRGLSYYEDIQFDVPIIMLTGEWTWDVIAKRLSDMLEYPSKTFRKMPLTCL